MIEMNMNDKNINILFILLYDKEKSFLFMFCC